LYEIGGEVDKTFDVLVFLRDPWVRVFLLFLRFDKASLDRSDAVAQTENDTKKRLRTNANESSKLAVIIVILQTFTKAIYTRDTLSQKSKKRVSHNQIKVTIQKKMYRPHDALVR
jgi:hypothetical protein